MVSALSTWRARRNFKEKVLIFLEVPKLDELTFEFTKVESKFAPSNNQKKITVLYYNKVLVFYKSIFYINGITVFYAQLL